MATAQSPRGSPRSSPWTASCRHPAGRGRDASFLLGPGLVIGIDSLVLAFVMYRARLVPRWIAVVGMIGGPLVLTSSTAVLFGAHERVSATAGLLAFPVFVWQMSLAAY